MALAIIFIVIGSSVAFIVNKGSVNNWAYERYSQVYSATGYSLWKKILGERYADVLGSRSYILMVRIVFNILAIFLIAIGTLKIFITIWRS